MFHFRKLWVIIFSLPVYLIMISCSQFLLPYFEVIDFSYDNEKLRIEFSSEVEKEKVRQAFSLTEDGNKIEGLYKTIGKSFYFYPEKGIRKNKDYELSISTAAEDYKGKSLKEKYYVSFSTKTDSTKPKVIKVEPVFNQKDNGKVSFIEISFSKAIKNESFIDAFSIEPEVSYTVIFPEECMVKILPSEKFKKNTLYTIKIKNELQDHFENHLEENYVYRFITEEDKKCPDFELTYFDEYDGSNIKLDTSIENHDIPVDAVVSILFTEEIDVDTVSSKIQVTPSSQKYSIQIDRSNRNKVEVKFNGEYEKKCMLKILNGIEDLAGNKTIEDRQYSLCFDNEYNRSVTFISSFIQIDDKKNYKELSYETQYTNLNLDPFYFSNDRITKPAELFLIFNISKKADSIDFYSILDALSFKTTNSCCTIIINKASLLSKDDFNKSSFNSENFGLDVNNIALKFNLEITNTNRDGTVEMNISDGVKDSLGNYIDKKYSFTFNK